MKRVLLPVAAGFAVAGAYVAVAFGAPRPGFGAEAIAALALPGLVTALVLVAYLAERQRLRSDAGTVNELSAQLIRKEIEIEHLSSRDELTGLHTRRHFEEALKAEFERSRRHGRPLSLLLMEMDDLNVLGERAGRLGRGYLLSQVSDALRGNMRRRSTTPARGSRRTSWRYCCRRSLGTTAEGEATWRLRSAART